MSALLKLVQKSSGTKIEEGRRNNFLNTSDVASACLWLYLHWTACLAATRLVLYESVSSPPVRITCVCRGMVCARDMWCVGVGCMLCVRVRVCMMCVWGSRHGVCVCVMCIVYGMCICQLQHRSLGPIPDLLIQILCAEVEGCGGSPGACILQGRQAIPMCAKV